jgi:hypothetical protein
MAEHQQFHGTVERGAIPAMIRAVHCISAFCVANTAIGVEV